ncbi:MAG: hypothetical protein HZB13_13590 [Acidobacteria bacterium]|nr:hypothetical protein [Acidobacteriota bacterium]
MKWALAVLTVSSALAQQPPPVKTGPEVGQKIPAFEAMDQNGKLQTLESLRGPKGLVLLFVRSADW